MLKRLTIEKRGVMPEFKFVKLWDWFSIFRKKNRKIAFLAKNQLSVQHGKEK